MDINKIYSNVVNLYKAGDIAAFNKQADALLNSADGCKNITLNWTIKYNQTTGELYSYYSITPNASNSYIKNTMAGLLGEKLDLLGVGLASQDYDLTSQTKATFTGFIDLYNTSINSKTIYGNLFGLVQTPEGLIPFHCKKQISI